jgi:hypothetical protein
VFDNLTGRTAAFEGHPGPPNTFGLVGLARLQTLALTAFRPPNPNVPPNPCVVGLTFLDAAGRFVVDRDDQPIARRRALLPGEFLALNLPAALVFSDAASLRVPIRAFVHVQPGPSDEPDACAGLTTTLEVVDALTGRTSLIYAAGQQPGPPTIGR